MAFRAGVFDLYGTLLDLSGLRPAVPSSVDADAFVATWRAKQLEYSWTCTVMRRQASFELLTEDALDWTLANHHIDNRPLRTALLQAYRELPPHPDAAPCLRQLRARGLRTGVLSNASEGAIRTALERAGLAGFLDDILSVERVGVFKPDRRVYRFAVDTLGVTAAEIAFQTANAWDAAGAAAAGLTVHWINRSGAPDEYDLNRTTMQATSLDAIPAALAGAFR